MNPISEKAKKTAEEIIRAQRDHYRTLAQELGKALKNYRDKDDQAIAEINAKFKEANLSEYQPPPALLALMDEVDAALAKLKEGEKV